MKMRLKGSLIVLAILFALVLPGAYAISFNGQTNDESISASMNAPTSGAVKFGISAGPITDIPFSGTGNFALSKKFTTGSSWSKVGVTITNADSYSGALGGAKDSSAKTTSAFLKLLALGADYINAYGHSSTGTGPVYTSGVDMTVNNGDADIQITTSADGKNKQTSSQLNTNPNGLDAITGVGYWDNQNVDHPGITVSGYYKSPVTSGNIGGSIWDGSLQGYSVVANNAKATGSDATQTVGLATDDSGNGVMFDTTAKKSLSTLTAHTEVEDGYLANYVSSITAHSPLTTVSQSFDEAGATSYINSNTGFKTIGKALTTTGSEALTANSGGVVDTYTSSVTDSLAKQAVANADGQTNNVAFANTYKQIGKSGVKNAVTNLAVDGSVTNFVGAAGVVSSTETGTTNQADSVIGNNLNIHTAYWDNKGIVNDFVHVDNGGAFPTGYLTDSTGSLTDYSGSATVTSNTPDVRAQGQTADWNLEVETPLSDTGTVSPLLWRNYFYGQAETNSAAIGHLLTGKETIQHAIDTAPGILGANNDIFLAAATYTGTGNRDITNNAFGEKSFTLWGASSYLDDVTANSVIDAQGTSADEHGIFGLTSALTTETFNFKNIDFNNGYKVTTGTMNGAAIDLETDANAKYVKVENCNFNNNHANLGGAIYISSMNGAAIDLETDANDKFVEVENCNFNNNHANLGGAIYISSVVLNAGLFGGASENNGPGATIDITGGKFSGNSAADYGGAIRNLGRLTTTGVTFENNQATNGGAVSNEGFSGATYTSTKDTFTGNVATADGGAIWMDAGTTVNALNDNFVNNHAVRGGGVLIDQTGGTATYTDTGSTNSGNMPNYVQIVP